MQQPDQHLDQIVGTDILNRLHAEAENDLSAQQRRQLTQDLQQLGVQAQNIRQQFKEMHDTITKTVSHWSRPSLPHSVATEVSADIATSAQLSPLLSAPTPPRSIVSDVLSDLLCDQQLQQLEAPSIPVSIADAVLSDIELEQSLAPTLAELAPPPAVPSVASSVLARMSADVVSVDSAKTTHVTNGPVTTSTDIINETDIHEDIREMEQKTVPTVPQTETKSEPEHLSPPLPPIRPLAYLQSITADTHTPHNPAPLVLVGGLVLALTLLGLSTAWPNLSAGALVLHALAQQISPLASWGFALLLLTSLVVTRTSLPLLRHYSLFAFALTAILIIPPLYGLVHGTQGNGNIYIGRNVTINRTVEGNVIAIGGHIHLEKDAVITGEVVTLLGDVFRNKASQVDGRVYALLGYAPNDRAALEVAPPSGLRLAAATAFQPVLGWLGGAAWPQLFQLLTAAMLVLLFLTGAAPLLAHRQRQMPARTLALGVLMLSALGGITVTLALVGWLGGSLIGSAFIVLITALGLSISVYDSGRWVGRLLPVVPNAEASIFGSVLVFGLLMLSLLSPILAFSFSLIGGVWGAGTLLGLRQNE